MKAFNDSRPKANARPKGTTTSLEHGASSNTPRSSFNSNNNNNYKRKEEPKAESKPKPGTGASFKKLDKKSTDRPTATQSARPQNSAASERSTGEDSTTKPVKVKKPKPPKPPVDLNEHITQRAFIGGLAKDVTPADVEGRFKSFGQLKDVYLAKDLDDGCRGFGYMTLDTTRKEWLKCLALFNGAKWKGHVLKIEEANKDWQTKRQEDLEKQSLLEKKEKDAVLKKIRRSPAKHAEDMSLVTEKNLDGRRGWKRGRYGRPIIAMRLDKMTYDPSHYKNNLEKLYNLSGNPLPLDQLVYRIDENEPIPKGKHLPTEVALAPFLAKSKSALSSALTTTPSIDTEKSKPTKPTTSTSEPQSLDKINTSDDRTMMASILAGIDLSPRALSLDGSDFEDDEHGGMYMEDIGVLEDTRADDLFGDVVMDDSAAVLSKAERDSRPEDLFGDDEEEDGSMSNQPSLDFLDEDDEEQEGEYDEDQEQEMESSDEDEVNEDEDEDEDGMDEETINAIAQLQGSSSTNVGGLFDSDDEATTVADKDTKASDLFDSEGDQDTTSATKFAEESNAARLKALEAREAELDAARTRQQQLIASTLANIDSKDKKTGHVVFEDSDDYDSEDYEKMETDHAKKMARMNKPAKSIFDSDSGSDDEDELAATTPKAKKGVKEMFASDDEEGDDTEFGKLGEPGLNIKEQFEGPGGKALFKMQTKIGTSDSRFQLTKDFLDDRIREEDDVDFVAHQDRLKGEEYASGGANATAIVLDEGRQAEADVTAEKMQAMNVLRAMFGDSAVRSKKKEEDTARKAKGGVGFTTGLTMRYDPDAVPPPPEVPTLSAPEPKTSAFDSVSASESGSEASSEQENDESDEVFTKDDVEVPELVEETKSVKKSVGFSFAFDTETLNTDDDGNKSMFSASEATTTKNLDTATKFHVATDLKSLFAPTTGSFKLFGGDDDEEEEEDEQRDVEDDRQDGIMDDRTRDEDMIMTSFTDGSKTIFATGAEALNRAPLSHSGSLFFFHFKNPSLLKRSNFKATNKVFMRTETMEEITSQWEKTRHTMTQEFKRKHKSASRNKARASKRFKTGSGGQEQS
ncbi:nucleolar protein 8 [Haplosporangium sp. Z 11]|nr:nucleolar protein 8 [Haplosporangium sp. Z 11]